MNIEEENNKWLSCVCKEEKEEEQVGPLWVNEY